MKVTLHGTVEGKVKTVSVKREAGNWYALFSCEVEAIPLQPLMRRSVSTWG